MFERKHFFFKIYNKANNQGEQIKKQPAKKSSQN